MTTIEFAHALPPQIHKLLNGSIAPRPIAWVSTIAEDGIPNLAPFSYFNIVSIKPAVLMFSAVNAPTQTSGIGRQKDTLQNIQTTKQCVIHLVPHALREEMNLTGVNWPAHENEFDRAGLSTLPSLYVAPARLADAPVAFECELDQIVSWGNHPAAGNAIFCRIIAAHFADGVLLEDDKVQLQAVDPIARMGGRDYSRAAGGVFTLPLPEELVAKP